MESKTIPPHLAQIAWTAKRHGWFVPWQLAGKLKWMSESTLTRRLRELRGYGYTVELKRIPDSSAYLYRVKGGAKCQTSK